MANGYFRLPAYDLGSGTDFSPVTNALTEHGQAMFRQQQMAQQAKNALMEQQRWEASNARADSAHAMQAENHRNALMDRNWQVPQQREEGQLGLEMKRAQIDKLRREPHGPEAPSNVREWQHFQGLSPDEQARYLTMKRADRYLDAGDRYIQPNPANPAGPVRSEVPKNLVEAERQKAEGKNQAEVAINKPKVEATLNTLDRQTTLVNQDIDRAISQANAATTGIGGAILSNVPGTPGYDLYQTLQTIKANIGFDKLQSMRENSPTGGALGQVSNFENELLQAVEGALVQGQSKEQLIRNLGRVKTLRQKVLDERKDAFRRTYSKNMGGPLPPETPDYKNMYGLD